MTVITTHKSYSLGTKKTLDILFSLLNLDEYISQLKEAGVDLVKLAKLITSFKMENPDTTFSISACARWGNQPEILRYFGLEPFDEQTLYRAVRTIGDNFESILKYLEKQVFSHIPTKPSAIFIDWTTAVLWGLHASLGAYGYSKAKRTDKHQVTIGAAMVSKPYCIPVGLTLQAGNITDMIHFRRTLIQISKELGEDTIIVFDKGASSQTNFELVEAVGLKYLTSLRFNKTLDRHIEKFWDSEIVCINDTETDEMKKLYAMTIRYPSRTDFIFFSQERKNNDIEAVRREVRKKFGVSDEYGMKKIKCNGTIQTQIIKYEDIEDQINEAVEAKLTGREGFFTLTTDADLTAEEAIKLYREKDAIEKFFHTMKTEMKLEPLRVRRNDAMKGVILITYLVQLFLAIMKYLIPDIAKKSVKFIIKELCCLTETVIYGRKGPKGKITSNFTLTNTRILNFDFEKSWVKTGG